MKITNEETKTIKFHSYTIVYENDIECRISLENNKIVSYCFILNRGDDNQNKLTYIHNINLLINSVWPDHSSYIKEKKFTEKQLLDFKEFDKLFYVGGHVDGTLRDNQFNIIPNLIKIDSSFAAIYLKINKEKKAIAAKEKFDNTDWVVSCEFADSYDWDFDRGGPRVNIEAHILPPAEYIKEYFQLHPKETYISEECKRFLCNKILKPENEKL